MGSFIRSMLLHIASFSKAVASYAVLNLFPVKDPFFGNIFGASLMYVAMASRVLLRRVPRMIAIRPWTNLIPYQKPS